MGRPNGTQEVSYVGCVGCVDEGCGEGRKGRTFYCLRIGSLTLDLDITLIQILLKVKLYSGL